MDLLDHCGKQSISKHHNGLKEKMPLWDDWDDHMS